MKSLRHYIAESIHLYECTIRIAGEIDKKTLDLFRANLSKFDPVEMSDPKNTPIQKNPYGFPGIQNQPVTIMKCKFRYPVTENMLQQMFRIMGLNPDLVKLNTNGYDESIEQECEALENQLEDGPLLSKEDMGSAPNAEEANKSYSNSYLDDIQGQSKESKLDIPYAGEKTPDSFDPFKPETYVDKKGATSPMTNIKLPEKPKTGAMN